MLGNDVIRTRRKIIVEQIPIPLENSMKLDLILDILESMAV